MPLLENGALVEDRWRPVADTQDLPDGPIVVSLARFARQRAALLAHTGGLGIQLRNTDPLEPLLSHLTAIDLIVLEFPKFTDGRAYSQARVLRERHGYRGRLRARGQVLVDQYLLMRRCGFDSFEIGRPLAVEAWRRAEERFTAFYQPAGDGRQPIAALRRNLRRGVARADIRSVDMRVMTSLPCSGDANDASSIPPDMRRPPLPDDAAVCTIEAK